MKYLEEVEKLIKEVQKDGVIIKAIPGMVSGNSEKPNFDGIQLHLIHIESGKKRGAVVSGVGLRIDNLRKTLVLEQEELLNQL